MSETGQEAYSYGQVQEGNEGNEEVVLVKLRQRSLLLSLFQGEERI